MFSPKIAVFESETRLKIEWLRRYSILGHSEGDRPQQTAILVVETNCSTVRYPDGVAAVVEELLSNDGPR